jgi:hypothetical protein
MKNFKNLVCATLLCISASLVLTVCDKDKHQEPDPDTLSVTPESLSFLPDGGEQSLTVETNVSDWTYSSPPDWISIDKPNANGKTLTVTAQKNTDYQNGRNATITVSAGEAPPVSVKVEQQAKVRDLIDLNYPSLNFQANESGDRIVTIGTSAPDWTFQYDAAWLSVVKANSTTLKVTITENKTIALRTCVITISSGDAKEANIIVIQEAAQAYLTLSTQSLAFTATGNTERQIIVETNAADTWSFSTSASWVRLNKSGTSTLLVNVDNNTSYVARNATVTVTAGSKTASFSVSQAAALYQFPTSFNRADGYYYGNKQGNGRALLFVDMYKSDNPYIGITVQTYGTLPSYFSSFKFATGTYSMVAGGQMDDGANGGSFIYAEEKIFYVTSGTMEVTNTSGTNYSITVNCSVKDRDTGETRTGLQMTFTGTLAFRCDDGCDTEPPKSDPLPPTGTYSGNGTPQGLVSGSASSWTGNITRNTAQTVWTITRWGGVSGTVYLKRENNVIIVDNQTKLPTSMTGYDFYFGTAVYYNSQWLIITDLKHPVSYNATSKVIDFTGSTQGLAVSVGIYAVSQSTNQLAGWGTDLYRGAKMTVTPSTYSAPLNSNVLQADEVIGKADLKSIKSITVAELRKLLPVNKATENSPSGYPPASIENKRQK